MAKRAETVTKLLVKTVKINAGNIQINTQHAKLVKTLAVIASMLVKKMFNKENLSDIKNR